jgi:hypothetical protein
LHINIYYKHNEAEFLFAKKGRGGKVNGQPISILV